MPPPVPIAPARPQIRFDGQDLPALSERLQRLVVREQPGGPTLCEAELLLRPEVDGWWHDGTRARLGVSLEVGLTDGWRFDGALQGFDLRFGEAVAPSIVLRATGLRAAPSGRRWPRPMVLTFGAQLLGFDLRVDADPAAADASAAAEGGAQLLRAQATVSGTVDLRAGEAVDLQGLGAPTSGRYAVVSVSLVWDAERGPRVELEAERRFAGA